ncbi:Glutaredoxin [Pseudonocardia thermophila]|uniref:Glutaredoxin n=1 Tax=Pseudonocardia thermophila TaxID=1848 RepID=A0A1M6XJ68_PSETH|nr:DUF6081 family protein [Pseudonocardia thermophila]SHL05991.1 Glutaredoxin [Pseudonocardia thermophila]
MLTADRVVLYMRQGCHVCARVKRFLVEHDVPFRVRDVDAEPLTPDELWALFTRKAGRLRVPFTALDDGSDVVLGYDPVRLEGVFLRGDRGGHQSSIRLSQARLEGGYADPARWRTTDPVDGAGTDALTTRTATRYVSVERFATPPGTQFSAEVGMAVAAPPGATGWARLNDEPGGIRFGFEVSAAGLVAVHERIALPGVTLPEECFAHRVLLDGGPVPDASHRLAITYRHDTGLVEWHLDGHRVYWATTPNPVEGVSLDVGLALDPAATGRPRARWTAWTAALR